MNAARCRVRRADRGAGGGIAGVRQAHDYWQTRQRLPFGSGMLSVVSRDTLIQMKASAARPQDIADIAKLREIDR
jgi:hypothetical protein